MECASIKVHHCRRVSADSAAGSRKDDCREAAEVVIQLLLRVTGKPTSTESPGTGVFEFSGAIWTPLDTLDSEFRAFLAASAIVSHVQN